MAFELETGGQKVEYVYPFICGLCGYGSSNIDLFHHHFEAHGDTVPSSVFHLCEMENLRNDGSESCINVGAFSCKACSHTFPTVCNLIEHLDSDPSTQQYIMDLKSKVAYPLTKDYAQVMAHTFPVRSKQKKKQSSRNLSGSKSSRNVSQNMNQSRGGKSGPKQISPTQGSYSFDQPFFQAESKQKRAGDVFNTLDGYDYFNDDDDDDNDDDNDDGNSDKGPNGDNSNSIICNSEDMNGVTQKNSWFSCKYCGLSVSKRKLKQHEKEHLTYEGNLKYSQQNMCKCEQCNYVMLKESSARHVCESLKPASARRTRAKRGEPKKGLDQTLIPCPNCNRLFKKYFINSHIKIVHRHHEPVPCEKCGKIFRHKGAMRTHVRNIHEAVKRFQCELCPYKCLSGAKLRVHMKRHMNERNYSCDQCPNRYKGSTELRRHKKTHMERTDTTVYQCELCPKSYGYRDGLAQHQRRLHNIRASGTESQVKPNQPKVKPYQCDQCVKTFVTPSLLENHINTHLGVTPFSCNECPNKYYTTHSLKRHKLWKHTEHNRTFKCEQCPKSFILPESLKKHVQVSHKPGEKKLLCGFRTCRHKFEMQEDLDRHRRLYHAEGMERQCTLCEKSYMNIEGLKQHMRLIHREKKQDGDKKRRYTPHKLLVEKDAPPIYRTIAPNDHAYTLSQSIVSAETICDLSTDLAEETVQCDESCKVDGTPGTGDTTNLANIPLYDDADEVLVATKLITDELDPDVTEDKGIDAFVCHKCPLPEIFMTPDSLKHHVQAKHTLPGHNQFICGWKTCRITFNKQEDLEKHMHIHQKSTIVQEKVLAAGPTKNSIAINMANKSPSVHNIPTRRADIPKSISGAQTVKTSTHGTQTGRKDIVKNVVTSVGRIQSGSKRIVFRKSVTREVPKGTGDGTQSIKSHSSPRILLIKKVPNKEVRRSAPGTAVDSVLDAGKASVPLSSSRKTRSATERKPETALRAVDVEMNQSVGKRSLNSVKVEGAQSSRPKAILIRTVRKKPVNE